MILYRAAAARYKVYWMRISECMRSSPGEVYSQDNVEDSGRGRVKLIHERCERFEAVRFGEARWELESGKEVLCAVRAWSVSEYTWALVPTGVR